ncbi:MAG TPA: hypothetical protein VIJ86_11110 [Acidimicrobiales bacterium]
MLTVPDRDLSTRTNENPWDTTVEVLFKEARRRERRRRLRRWGSVVLVVGIVSVAMVVGVRYAGSSLPSSRGPVSVASNTSVKVITCSGSSVVRPRTLVVSCADANTVLTSTRWSTWNVKGANGTTTFGMNLCTPYCAASPISYFPHSTVRLYAPETSAHGTHFSELVVTYDVSNKVKTFDFSWTGATVR